MREPCSTSTFRPKKRQRARPSNGSLINILVLCKSLNVGAHPFIVETRSTPTSKSCDAVADTCPTQFDGQCDRNTNVACSSGDCYDCDECQQYHEDCASCIANGCFFCPGDATCFNSPDYVLTNVFSHCSTPSDFLKDTCQQASNFFQDPLYSAEAWVYDMIRVVEVWKQGIWGDGVRVRVNDNGVDSTHLEFKGRFDINASCDRYDPQELATETGFHGTVVAGIVGGAANNGKCSVGIAPNVTISSCYVFDGSDYFDVKMDSYDISQNSYGIDGCKVRTGRQLQIGSCPFKYFDPNEVSPCTVCTNWASPSQACEAYIKQHCQRNYEYDVDACLDFLDMILGGNCLYTALNDWEREAITKGITVGRSGKGIIYLFASGNAYKAGDDTNFQAYTNSRFFITVGAVGKDRIHASYSTPGASLFAVGPGGDFENVANHVTAGPGNTCIDAGLGTSFATPVVSGVVALMLQANPDLTWRDVQHIIAGTSQHVIDSYDESTTVNAAGYWHSNLYGFGIVDAAAAVEAAQRWYSVGPEKMLLADSGIVGLLIVDDASVIMTTTLNIPSPSQSFFVESVVVQLDLQYFTRGNLEITLKSPQGTQSILSPGKRPETTQLASTDRWKLLTVRNWGENPDGNWTLSIVDLQAGDAGTCASGPWSMLLGQQELDCTAIDQLGLCVDGVLDPKMQLTEPLFEKIFGYQDNGVKATDACCSCGGGLSKAEVRHQLQQWTLVVYGYVQDVVTDRMMTESPTIAPTTERARAQPVSPPSKIPTPSPTARPTNKPTQRPTKQPSVGPTVAPTMPPTIRQTSQEASKQPTPQTDTNTQAPAAATNRPTPGDNQTGSGRPATTAPPSPTPINTKAPAGPRPPPASTNRPTPGDPPTGSGHPATTAPPSRTPVTTKAPTTPRPHTAPTNKPTAGDPQTGSGSPAITARPSPTPTKTPTVSRPPTAPTSRPSPGVPPTGSGQPARTAPPTPRPTGSKATTGPLKTNPMDATSVPTSPDTKKLTVAPEASPSSQPTEKTEDVAFTDASNDPTTDPTLGLEESSSFPTTSPTLDSLAPTENATTSNTRNATLDPSTSSPTTSIPSTVAPSLRPSSPPPRPNQPATSALGSGASTRKSASNRVASFTIALLTTLLSSMIIIFSFS